MIQPRLPLALCFVALTAGTLAPMVATASDYSGPCANDQQAPVQADVAPPFAPPSPSAWNQGGYLTGNASMMQPGYLPGNGAMMQPGYLPGNGAMMQPGYLPGNGAMMQPGYLPGNGAMMQPGYLPGSAAMMQPGYPRASATMPLPEGYSGYAQQQSEMPAFVLNSRADNIVPPATLQGWLQRTHPEFNLALQSNPDAVLEIKGRWDNSSQVLKAMGIRYHEMSPRELRSYPLSNVKVIVVNCEGKIPADAVEPVRQWVVRGGCLISTDWTLSNFLQRAFPGMVEFNGKKVAADIVDAMVMPGEPQLTAGIQTARAMWKLDDQSEEVRILRPDAVHVLAHSFRLAESDPNKRFSSDPMQSGVLALVFNYGRGRVLHLVGHFDYNSEASGWLRHFLPDAIPGAGIGLRQALATNFLIQALETTPGARAFPFAP